MSLPPGQVGASMHNNRNDATRNHYSLPASRQCTIVPSRHSLNCRNPYFPKKPSQKIFLQIFQPTLRQLSSLPYPHHPTTKKQDIHNLLLLPQTPTGFLSTPTLSTYHVSDSLMTPQTTLPSPHQHDNFPSTHLIPHPHHVQAHYSCPKTTFPHQHCQLPH
jgi:hypothetical protein